MGFYTQRFVVFPLVRQSPADFVALGRTEKGQFHVSTKPLKCCVGRVEATFFFHCIPTGEAVVNPLVLGARMQIVLF